MGDDAKLEPGFPLALMFKIGVILVNSITECVLLEQHGRREQGGSLPLYSWVDGVQ